MSEREELAKILDAQGNGQLLASWLIETRRLHSEHVKGCTGFCDWYGCSTVSRLLLALEQAERARDAVQEELLRLRDVEGLAWQTKVRDLELDCDALKEVLDETREEFARLRKGWRLYDCPGCGLVIKPVAKVRQTLPCPECGQQAALRAAAKRGDG